MSAAAREFATQLLDMELEVEDVLRAYGVRDLGVRDDCSIVRGILALVLDHDAPGDLAAAEKRLADIATKVGMKPEWTHNFLLRLRRKALVNYLAA